MHLNYINECVEVATIGGTATSNSEFLCAWAHKQKTLIHEGLPTSPDGKKLELGTAMCKPNHPTYRARRRCLFWHATPTKHAVDIRSAMQRQTALSSGMQLLIGLAEAEYPSAEQFNSVDECQPPLLCRDMP